MGIREAVKFIRLYRARKKLANLKVEVDEREVMLNRLKGADGYMIRLAQEVLDLRIKQGKLTLIIEELKK